MSVTLSPTLTLFIPPYGKLYLKMQLVIAQAALSNSPVEIPKRRPGPKKPKHGIPRLEWPKVHARIRQGESLRAVAQSYNVSYETVRRVIQAYSRQELT